METLKPFVTSDQDRRGIDILRTAQTEPAFLLGEHDQAYRYHHFVGTVYLLRKDPLYAHFIERVNNRPDKALSIAKKLALTFSQEEVILRLHEHLLMRQSYAKYKDYQNLQLMSEGLLRHINDMLGFPLETVAEEVLREIKSGFECNNLSYEQAIARYPFFQEFIYRLFDYRNRKYGAFLSFLVKLQRSRFDGWLVAHSEKIPDNLCHTTGYDKSPSDHCFMQQLNYHHFDEAITRTFETSEGKSAVEKFKALVEYMPDLTQFINEKLILIQEDHLRIHYSLLTRSSFLNSIST